MSTRTPQPPPAAVTTTIYRPCPVSGDGRGAQPYQSGTECQILTRRDPTFSSALLVRLAGLFEPALFELAAALSGEDHARAAIIEVWAAVRRLLRRHRRVSDVGRLQRLLEERIRWRCAVPMAWETVAAAAWGLAGDLGAFIARSAKIDRADALGEAHLVIVEFVAARAGHFVDVDDVRAYVRCIGARAATRLWKEHQRLGPTELDVESIVDSSPATDDVIDAKRAESAAGAALQRISGHAREFIFWYFTERSRPATPAERKRAERVVRQLRGRPGPRRARRPRQPRE